MSYHRGVGQVTPAQVQPWIDLATQTASSIAQAVQQGQQPAQPPPPTYDPGAYAPTPASGPSWITPVMIGGGMLLALGVGYVALNKRMKANGRRRRIRRNSTITRVGDWDCRRGPGAELSTRRGITYSSSVGPWMCQNRKTGERVVLHATLKRPTMAAIKKAMESKRHFETERARVAKLRNRAS